LNLQSTLKARDAARGMAGLDHPSTAFNYAAPAGDTPAAQHSEGMNYFYPDLYEFVEKTLLETQLLACLQNGFARGWWGNEFQTRVWESAGALRGRREAPVASARGKVLPLQIQKRSA
jgi:hypothetical protein